jgi:hypothetical protein
MHIVTRALPCEMYFVGGRHGFKKKQRSVVCPCVLSSIRNYKFLYPLGEVNLLFTLGFLGMYYFLLLLS